MKSLQFLPLADDIFTFEKQFLIKAFRGREAGSQITGNPPTAEPEVVVYSRGRNGQLDPNGAGVNPSCHFEARHNSGLFAIFLYTKVYIFHEHFLDQHCYYWISPLDCTCSCVGCPWKREQKSICNVAFLACWACKNHILCIHFQLNYCSKNIWLGVENNNKLCLQPK